MIIYRVILVVVAALAIPLSAPAQETPLQPADLPDGIPELLNGLRDELASNNEIGLLAAMAPTAAPAVSAFAAELVVEGDVVRALVIERDRRPLEGSPEGDGYSLVVEFFTETAQRARIVTARLDVSRPENGEPGAWRIVDAEQLTRVEGLYRLRLNQESAFLAQNLSLQSEDFELNLPSGTVFEVQAGNGVTGLVLMGRGTVRFAPEPEAERGQVELFAGTEVLDAEFDAAFLRFSITQQLVESSSPSRRPAPADTRLRQRAEEIFAEEAPKSYGLDLGDLSSDIWYLLPQTGDFVAEIHTREYGDLTYSRTIGQQEDISLFSREEGQTIALYASHAKLQRRGPFYNEDDAVDIDILDYGIDVDIRYISGPRTAAYPVIDGAVRMTLRALTPGLSTLILRLDDELFIEGIASVKHGPLLYLRLRNQNRIVISLPAALALNEELTLLISYNGPVTDEPLDNSPVTRASALDVTFPFYAPERNLLLSNRSYWYPQGTASDYATATLRVSVPDGLGAVASGTLTTETSAFIETDSGQRQSGRTLVFRAPSPVRYLSVIVSPFVKTGGTRLQVMPSDGSQDAGLGLPITVSANPRQSTEGRELLEQVQDIVSFYVELMEAYPYESLSLALVESSLPGGHSPGYAIMLNSTVPGSPFTWRNDPSWFPDYPEFFLAHEIAHQWWGQAVGWKNYHEQWISEGFAQYFSALYAEHVYGEETFTDMLEQFDLWSDRESASGPIYLGYRLGLIQKDARVFRSLVYNKSAAVLHMLRRLVGDEVFFTGLRQFYQEFKFAKAGTDDLRQVFEAVSGRSLSQFFDQWIYGRNLPRIAYRSTLGPDSVTMRFEQLTETLFDVPITVSLTHVDGSVTELVVPVTDRIVEHDVTVTVPVREVQVNRDFSALGEIVEN